MFLKNESLLQEMSSCAEDRDEILKSILRVEEYYNRDDNLARTTRERYLSGRKKHNRRCANEIPRGLACPYAMCTKSYASEGSLNLHIKIKHNGGNKTDREKIAKSIVYAKAKGIDISQDLNLQVNLPPGSIQQAAEALNIELDQNNIDRLEDEIQKKNEENRLKQKKEELMRAQKYPSMMSHASFEDNIQNSND